MISVRIRTRLLLLLIAVSIGFGLLKQVKTAVRSTAEMAASHEEAGAALHHLKQRLVETEGASVLSHARFGYVTDRRQIPGGRPLEQFYYDAQYAFTPYVLHPNDTSADYQVRDPSAGPPQIFSKKEGKILV